MRGPPKHRLSLDVLTFVVSRFLLHHNQDAIYRILKADGHNSLPPAEQACKPHGGFEKKNRLSDGYKLLGLELKGNPSPTFRRASSTAGIWI